MKRRQFLETATAAPLAGFWLQPACAADFPVPDLGGLFEASSPEVLSLARRVMEKCVLDKIWPPTNYQIASGLAAYGHQELAADIADKTIANAIENGISENYDSVTGKALGVADYSMSSTLVAMMLDGLSRKHQLKLRGE